MMREPKRDYLIAITLAFLVLICCIPLAGAHDSNGTVALDNATGISGNNTVAESPTEMIPVTTGTEVGTEGAQNVTLPEAIIPTLAAVTSPEPTTIVEMTPDEPTPQETPTISSNESLCSECTGTTALTSSKAQSFATNTLESMSLTSFWDVAVRFDNAPGNNFYPFSPSPGVVGTPYYAVLGSSDNLVRWIPYCYRGCGWQTCNWAIIGRKPCEQLSTSCESLDPLTSGCICFGGLKNAARMDGWFVERTRISDTKYHVKIVGQSVYRADPRGALWLNPDSGWKFTHLDSCYVQADQGSPPRPVSCALTSDTMLQFQAAGDCAGSCACEDAGSINIDVIAEKTATPPEPPTYSATLVGKYNPQDNRADAKAYLIWYQLNNLNSNMITRAFTHCNTDLLGFAGRCDGPVTKPDFSTEGGGLSNAVLHYHFSHGENGKINLGGDFLLPGEVSGKWNNKNKWVVIDACEVLSDRSWGNALGTSHGVLGFETVKPLDDQLAKYFVQNLNSGKTVYNSYFDATRSA